MTLCDSIVAYVSQIGYQCFPEFVFHFTVGNFDDVSPVVHVLYNKYLRISFAIFTIITIGLINFATMQVCVATSIVNGLNVFASSDMQY